MANFKVVRESLKGQSNITKHNATQHNTKCSEHETVVLDPDLGDC